MRVKPTDGLSIIDPDTRTTLPKEGMDVPDDSHYWLRRLRDGDVVVATVSNDKEKK